MKRTFMGGSIALVVVALSGPAYADASASARLDSFGYRLIDLRPGDGLAPSITFRRGGSSSVVALAVEQTPRFDLTANDVMHDGFGAFKPMSAVSDTPMVNAEANMAGSMAKHDFGFSTRGSFLNDRASSSYKEFVARASPVGEFGVVQFEVTPFTRVVFAGQLNLSAKTSGFMENAEALLKTDISTAPGITTPRLTSLLVGLNTGKVEDHLSQWERFVYNNGTAAQSIGSFSAWVEIYGAANWSALGAADRISQLAFKSSAPPIPEPSTSALTLCGLGIVLCLARRSRLHST